jgi:hypothetical protein
MLKRSLLLIAITGIFSALATGQSVYTPEPGSAERKAILDALRIPVERELKQPIVFVPDEFNVLAYWAFVSGEPRSAGGGQPDYSATKYYEAYGEGAFDNNFFALLKKTGGKWRVVTFAIGCTDVCYSDWAKRFKAPKLILPYSE